MKPVEDGLLDSGYGQMRQSASLGCWVDVIELPLRLTPHGVPPSSDPQTRGNTGLKSVRLQASLSPTPERIASASERLSDSLIAPKVEEMNAHSSRGVAAYRGWLRRAGVQWRAEPGAPRFSGPRRGGHRLLAAATRRVNLPWRAEPSSAGLVTGQVQDLFPQGAARL